MTIIKPKYLIREDGRIERLCEHGIGHTVGHTNSKMLIKNWIWIHGCDGCCSTYLTQLSGPLEGFKGEK